jgi:phosphotransferase system enzyme I (PtsP)
VERVQSDTRARMLRSTDPYLRERLYDLDLGDRLMRAGGRPRPRALARHLPERRPDRARDGLAALLDYDRALRGLVLEEGTANSHVAIRRARAFLRRQC